MQIFGKHYLRATAALAKNTLKSAANLEVDKQYFPLTYLLGNYEIVESGKMGDWEKAVQDKWKTEEPKIKAE